MNRIGTERTLETLDPPVHDVRLGLWVEQGDRHIGLDYRPQRTVDGVDRYWIHRLLHGGEQASDVGIVVAGHTCLAWSCGPIRGPTAQQGQMSVDLVVERRERGVEIAFREPRTETWFSTG